MDYRDSTQLLFLRARYYNPADARFMSRDTWAGDVNNPLSLNRWMYVEGNPINNIDPSGLFSQSQIKHMFKSARYLEAVNKYRNHPYLSSRWGFWEVLHRADNNDRIEFYTFSLNGDCARDTYSPNPVITQPFLRIKGIRHAISNVEKGRIFWSGSTL